MDKETIERLVAHALEMVPRAYAPYSRFQVGAAVLAASGKIYGGANVENASYPAGICAERSAIAQAISAGERKLAAIAICGGKDGAIADYCPPCGICRQVMAEFCAPDFKIILRDGENVQTFTLSDLLPLWLSTVPASCSSVSFSHFMQTMSASCGFPRTEDAPPETHSDDASFVSCGRVISGNHSLFLLE